MNLTLSEFIHCIFKAILWLGINLIFALAPVWIIFYLGSLELDISAHDISKEEIKRLVNECGVLFICCVFMGAVNVDFLFSDIKVGKKTMFVLTLLAIVPLLLVCVPYAFLVFDKGHSHDFKYILWLQKYIIWYGAFYCVITKTFLFIHEKNRPHVRNII